MGAINSVTAGRHRLFKFKPDKVGCSVDSDCFRVKGHPTEFERTHVCCAKRTLMDLRPSTPSYWKTQQKMGWKRPKPRMVH